MTLEPINTAKALGAHLRAWRHQLGLSLEGVERKSDGRWKGVLVGSYERGDRAVTVAKLAGLLAWYSDIAGVRFGLALLGPGDVVVDGARDAQGATTAVEWLVVYGGPEGDVIVCDDQAQAERRSAMIPGSSPAYRTVHTGPPTAVS